MSQAANFGTAVFSGNGCSAGSDKKIEFVRQGSDKYRITNAAAVSKKTGSVLQRKNCNMRIPIQLSKNEKIIISQISQAYQLQASPGATVRVQLELFLVGQPSQPLAIEAKGQNKESKVKGVLKSEASGMESGCGKDVILAGKFDTVVSGAGAGTANTEAIDFMIQTKTCP